MDFEDPRLKNILKLKAEFEKELEKMGKLKKKKVSVKKQETRLKIDISPPANVKATEVGNLLDINRQDYDSTDASVVKALRKGIYKIGDVRRRTLVEGIIKMLEGDLEGAREIFTRFDTPDFKYMLGLVKLYSSDPDVLEYSLGFLKKNPRSSQPYLLLTEVMISLGRYEDATKFLNVVKTLSGDPYIDLILKIYNGDKEAKKSFTYVVNKGGFRTLLAILSIYIEKSMEKGMKIAQALKKKDSPCSRSVAHFWTSEDPSPDHEKYPFCPRLAVMTWARRFERDELDEDPRKGVLWTDPLVSLFLGIYSYSIGEVKSADEYFKKFEDSVGSYVVRVIKSQKVVSKLGMRMFYEPVQGDTVSLVKSLRSGELDRAILSAKEMNVPSNHIDVKVEFRDPEILRLLFGFRHCKFLYS